MCKIAFEGGSPLKEREIDYSLSGTTLNPKRGCGMFCVVGQDAHVPFELSVKFQLT